MSKRIPRYTQFPAEPLHFQLWVDYTRTLSEMIAAGDYDSVDSEVLRAPWRFAERRVAHEGATLINLERQTTTEEVLSVMALRNLRPATLLELLQFGVEYPDMPAELERVWALTEFHLDGFDYKASIGWDPDDNGFNLTWERDLMISLEDDWKENNFFLAIAQLR
jgi:hypothetical protein